MTEGLPYFYEVDFKQYSKKFDKVYQYWFTPPLLGDVFSSEKSLKCGQRYGVIFNPDKHRMRDVQSEYRPGYNRIMFLDFKKKKGFYSSFEYTKVIYDKLIEYGELFEVANQYLSRSRYKETIKERMNECLQFIQQKKEDELTPLEQKIFGGIIELENDIEDLFSEKFFGVIR